VVEGVVDISRRLGWHEDAIDWLLTTRHAVAALRYVKEGGFPVTAEMFDRLAERYLDERAPGMESHEALQSTFLNLLSAVVQTVPQSEAGQRVEDFFFKAYGRFIFADTIGETGTSLLLRVRASAVIIALVHLELQLRREPSPQLLEFGRRLARAAAETGDPRLAACDAYFHDMRQFGRAAQRFELAAGGLELAPPNLAVLGHSSKRYRDVVEKLMADGAIEEAELYCRMNHDPGLAAAFAEKRGDMKDALRYYRDARDLDGALRCARASGDERVVARALEWRGEYAEALRIWRVLGRKADVARLLKKYPLLGG
jgi:tetratricopeptide (TPR) repeat protein